MLIEVWDKFLKACGLARWSLVEGINVLMSDAEKECAKASQTIDALKARAETAEIHINELEGDLQEAPHAMVVEILKWAGEDFGLDAKSRQSAPQQLADRLARYRTELEAALLRQRSMPDVERLVKQEALLSQFLTGFLNRNPGYRFQYDAKASASEAVQRILEFQEQILKDQQTKG